jgi:hypothetical protein
MDKTSLAAGVLFAATCVWNAIQLLKAIHADADDDDEESLPLASDAMSVKSFPSTNPLEASPPPADIPKLAVSTRQSLSAPSWVPVETIAAATVSSSTFFSPPPHAGRSTLSLKKRDPPEHSLSPSFPLIDPSTTNTQTSVSSAESSPELSSPADREQSVAERSHSDLLKALLQLPESPLPSTSVLSESVVVVSPGSVTPHVGASAAFNRDSSSLGLSFVEVSSQLLSTALEQCPPLPPALSSGQTLPQSPVPPKEGELSSMKDVETSTQAIPGRDSCTFSKRKKGKRKQVTRPC